MRLRARQGSGIRVELRKMMALAFPIALAELGWMAQGIVDVGMVGHLGPTAIGAAALGNSLYYVPTMAGVMLLVGLETVVARSRGQRDLATCSVWFDQGLYLSLALTVLISLLLRVLLFVVSGHFSQTVLTQDAVTYVGVLTWGTAPLLLFTAARYYLQALGQVRVVMMTLLSANLLNWAADFILINGKLGLPVMALRGAAVSTVLARLVMAAVLLCAVWRQRHTRGSCSPSLHALSRAKLIELLSIGSPVAAQVLCEVSAFAIASVVANRISPSAMAAHQIALNYVSLAYMVPLGLAAATTISVARALGESRIAKARRALRHALLICVAFTAGWSALFLSQAPTLTGLFSPDPQVRVSAAPLFLIAPLFISFDAAQTILAGALRGMSLTRVPLFVNLLATWLVGLPLGIYLASRGVHGLHGVAGLWIGLTAAHIVTTSVLSVYWATVPVGLRIES